MMLTRCCRTLLKKPHAHLFLRRVAIWLAVIAFAALPSIAQERSPTSLRNYLPNVGVTPPTFTLRHRFEIDPEINASWRVYPEKPPVTVDLERLGSDDLEYIFSISREIVSLSPVRGTAKRQRVLSAILARLEKESSRRVGAALASAACTLASNPDELASVWKVVQDRAAIRMSVEQILVQQKSGLALQVWRDRLGGQEQSRTPERLVAIEGLGVAGEVEDQPALLAIFSDANELITLRIAAAKSLGRISSAGLEDLAKEQMNSAHPLKELMASYLLVNHSSQAALSILGDILDSNSVAAQVVAYGTLVDVKPLEALEHLGRFAKAADDKLRRAVIRLASKWNDVDSVALLFEGLADKVEANRAAARNALIAKAEEASFRQAITKGIDATLSTGEFREREQACLLAGELSHRQACPALMMSLSDSNARTRNAAAWALQELVHESKHLEQIDRILAEATKRNFSDIPLATEEAVKVAFLVEALGRNNYQGANKTLVRYVPKGSADEVLRAAAIWTLGKNLRGNPNRKLANLLAQRLNDNSPSPESPLVKFASAIALGMMGDPSSEAQLLKHETRPPFAIGLARDWALQQYKEPEAN